MSAISLRSLLYLRRYSSFASDLSQHKQLTGEDAKIEAHNKRIRLAYQTLIKAEEKFAGSTTEMANANPEAPRYARLSEALRKAEVSVEKARVKYQNESNAGKKLIKTGSGQVSLWIAR